VGYRPKNTLDGYKEAIRRGYHIVEAPLQFTRDKVILILNKEKNISNKYYEDFEGKKILTFEEY
jgi:glycerophosphoryl diester phosphodiesterase